jgi:hypothetical protein
MITLADLESIQQEKSRELWRVHAAWSRLWETSASQDVVNGAWEKVEVAVSAVEKAASDIRDYLREHPELATS